MQQIKSQHISGGGYEIEQSLLFDHGYLLRTVNTPATGTKMTLSCWVKLGDLAGSQRTLFYSETDSSNFEKIAMNANGNLYWNNRTNGSVAFEVYSTRVFRDPSAWYHLCFVYDSNNGDPVQRAMIYVNGEQFTSSTTSYPSQGASADFMSPGLMEVGTQADLNFFLGGYMAELYGIEGQALGPENFALTDSKGVYNPIPYAGTYGTNGLYLPFEASNIGADASGNNNNFTLNGLTSDSVVADSPTNNYCTLNPLDPTGSTYSNGNLTTTGNTITTFDGIDGKWYYEKDGVGVTVDGTVGTVGAGTYNFGQRSFSGSAPSGYKAICTKNLPYPLVRPKDNFAVNLWSGNTQGNPNVTGFQPGLVWVKRRDTDYDHYLVDTVRGRTKALSSNDTGMEEAKASGIVSWDDNGFATGADNGFSGNSMVGWSFKAGSTGTNTDGGKRSTVSANKDMGFSVVKWNFDANTDATIGHGLGKIPNLIIIKKSSSYLKHWEVYSTPTGVDKGLVLNEAGAAAPTTAWSSTQPTDKVFSYGQEWGDYIAYCFANTEMVQVGSYQGNGLDDGTFVSLPFKPAFLLLTSTTMDAGWQMVDNARSPKNVIYKRLLADLSREERDNVKMADFLSNGFKCRYSDSTMNGAGQEYLYLAISEQPFKHSRGR